jgi:hypothetical protein
MNVPKLQSGIFTIIKFSKSRVTRISTNINAEIEGQNFLYAHKESLPLTALVFAKLTTAHWHYVEILLLSSSSSSSMD